MRNISSETTIFFIRHGEVYNPDNIFYGRLPRFSLSETGYLQVKSTIPYFVDKNISRIYSSPLLRAKKTADIIRYGINKPNIYINTLLNEVYSPYDGHPISNLEAKHWDIYSKIDPEYEQPQDILTRVLKFSRNVIKRYPAEEIIAVTHADVIVFLTLWIHGYEAKYQNKALIEKKQIEIPFPANASITKTTWSSAHVPPLYEYISPGRL